MSCLTSFLWKRELGQGHKSWKLKSKTEDLMEDYGAQPGTNEPCKLSKQCRATFLTDFSPDGKKIASTHGDHTVRVTEVATGKCTHVLHGHPRTPWCLAFHPSSNQILASGCLGGEVRIWDLHGGGSEVWRSKDNFVIASLTFHPTDHVLVFAVGNSIYFWDWSQSEPFTCRQTKHEYERVRWVRFDPLGQNLLTGIANNTTVQQTNTTRVSYMNPERQNALNRAQPQPPQNRLSNVYDSLVECFHAYRRDRGQGQPSSTQPTQSTASDEAQRPEAVTVSDETPRSPVLEEGLNLARQYASHVTNSSSQEQPSNFSIQPRETESIASAIPPPSAQSSRVAGNQYTRPGSPPPRGASSADVDVIMEEEILPSDGSGTTVNRNDPVISFSQISSGTEPRDIFGNSDVPGSVSGLNSAGSSEAASVNLSDNLVASDNSNVINVGQNLQGGRPHCTLHSSRPGLDLSSSSLDCDNNCEACRNYSRDHVQNRLSAIHNNRSRAGVHQNQSLVARYFRQRQSPFSLSRRREHASPFVRVIPRFRRHASASEIQSMNRQSSNSEATSNLGSSISASEIPLLNPQSSYSEATSNLGPSRTGNINFTNLLNPSQRHSHQLTLSSLSNSLGTSNLSNSLGTSNSEESPLSVDVGASEPLHQSSEGQQQTFTSDAVMTDSTDVINQNSNSNVHFNFANITARIQREMNELDRRINALRNTFNESIRQLQQNRETYSRVGSRRLRGVYVNPSAASSSQVTPPVITVTRCRDGQRTSVQLSNDVEGASVREGNPSHLLENALRTSPPQVHQPVQQQPQGNSLRDDVFPDDSAHSWHSLQRHHLHPHYAISILDDTINRPNDALQTAINRAIADAFMGRGEQAVANNIINQTHRIQMWDFTDCQIPDITDNEKCVVVPHCKIHNDASCDISQDGTYLAVFVPCHRGFPDDIILSVFSLMPQSRGQCLYTKSFGPNATSVSLSPRNHYIMVGLAAKRLSWVFTSKQLVSRIFKLDKEGAGEKSMKHVTDVMHPCDMNVRTHVSVNSARWLPGVGDGIVYGTNRGDLHICRPGSKNEDDPEKSEDPNLSGTSIRRNLMDMIGLSATTPLISIATQTGTHGVRRSAGTQTDHVPEEDL